MLLSTSDSRIASSVRVFLFGDASSRISHELLSLAKIAYFKMIRHLSHRNSGSQVGLSQKGSIPKRARSFGADYPM